MVRDELLLVACRKLTTRLLEVDSVRDVSTALEEVWHLALHLRQEGDL